jgi:hypothetical protein
MGEGPSLRQGEAEEAVVEEEEVTIATHTTCDNCESLIYLTGADGEECREEIQGEGWYVVDWGEDEETHFCGKKCLAVWACVHAGTEIGLPQ